MINRPATVLEIRNNAQMRKYFPDLSESTDNSAVVYYITNVLFNPADLQTLQADRDMVQRLCTFPVEFAGYTEFDTQTPEELLFECYTHFLGEGLDEAGADAEMQRIRDLFDAAGYKH